MNWHDQKKDIKLCFIGDTGTVNATQALIKQSLEKEKCDSLHFLGDIIYPAGIETSQDPILYSNFIMPYQSLEPHRYMIMGNHDYRGNVDAWFEISRNYPKIIFPNYFYFLSHPQFCIVSLDTNLLKIVSQWPKAIDQAFWLKDLENDIRKCPLKIALTHHPYQSRGHHHGSSTGLTKWFLEYFILGKFDYLISGHEHILSDEGMINGTHQLISGGGSIPDENEDAGYLVMVIKEDKPQLTFKRFQLKDSL